MTDTPIALLYPSALCPGPCVCQASTLPLSYVLGWPLKFSLWCRVLLSCPGWTWICDPPGTAPHEITSMYHHMVYLHHSYNDTFEIAFSYFKTLTTLLLTAITCCVINCQIYSFCPPETLYPVTNSCPCPSITQCLTSGDLHTIPNFCEFSFLKIPHASEIFAFLCQIALGSSTSSRIVFFLRAE